MQVTEVKLRKHEKGKMLAFADCTFDGVLTIKGWKLFKGRDGREFDLGPPSERDKSGAKNDDGSDKYWPFVYFAKDSEASRQLFGHIRDSIVEAYSDNGTPHPPEGTDQTFSGGDDIPF